MKRETPLERHYVRENTYEPTRKGKKERMSCELRNNNETAQIQPPFNQNIFLIGFMGTGKTTIAEQLSAMFAMNVVEMDKIIAQRAGMSIPDIFETYGETHFREMETQLVMEMQEQNHAVISCGGGTPMRQENVKAMKASGKIVLLTASPETIYERVKDSHDRPILENNKSVSFIRELMEQRREKYEAAADIIIETDGKSKLEICEELESRLMEGGQ